MSAQTTTLDIPLAPVSGKHLYEDPTRVHTPPIAAVRARHVQDEIEMNVPGASRPAEPSALSEDPEPEINWRKEWSGIAACGWCLFSSGWNDSSIGPLLPTIQSYYGLSFTVISLLFVFGCIGSISAVVLNVYLTDRLGFGRVTLLGALCQIVAYSILAPAFQFPIMCLAYVINGFGTGLQDYQSNGFVAALPYNTSAKMGLLHSCYGAGAFIAPMITTQFAQHPKWSYHYLATLGMAVVDAIILFGVFRLHTQEELLGPTQTNPSEAGNKERKYQQIFRSWAIQLMAVLVCFMLVPRLLLEAGL
ncbi:hypothetical protein FS749_002939 [Ceratobasidium sp. UAMH 11750]|nr:hypothetical protein FS749_002939 [Ceratobasidium sp. UAMH 11750]